MEQPFTDILIRIRKGSGDDYPVEAWLSDGSVYEGTARLTSVCGRQLLESDLDPVTYGQQLFKALFDGPIATAYDFASGLARQRSDGRLRIRLLLDEDVPAELHDAQVGASCAIRRATYRWRSPASPPSRAIRRCPKRNRSPWTNRLSACSS